MLRRLWLTIKRNLFFLTFAEMVEDFHHILTEREREYLVRRGPLELHFSTGTWIRNRYRLWDRINPLIAETDEKHPDHVSQRVLSAVYRKCLAERK